MNYYRLERPGGPYVLIKNRFGTSVGNILGIFPHTRHFIMSEKTEVPLNVEIIPSVSGGISGVASAQAPFIYFENAPFFGCLNGVGKVALETSRQIAVAPGGGVLFDRVLVAHLVGNIEAIKSLRAALDGILLMAEPKPVGPAN
ncbi:MAG TPA: hypothetical protein VIE66_05300 [Methylocella sp.]